MREIWRTIASGIVISKDGRILLGRKDPNKGGVYKDAWHLPGGGVEEGESLEACLARELKDEIGLDIARDAKIVKIESVGHGTSEKTLENGETVLCYMEFNRFEIRVDKNADEIEIRLNEDLVEAKWFTRQELLTIKQIPGGKEFFEEMGYIPKIPNENKMR